MIRKIIFLFLLLSSSRALAQYTNVTATVKDVTGALYVNCFYNVQFVNQSTLSQQSLLAGSVFQQTYSGARCDSTGSFTTVLPDNNVITPTPSQWNFSICSQDAKTCFNTNITITGASQSITAALQTASAPLLASAVTSVFGRTGAVVSASSDYAFSQISGVAGISQGGTGQTTSGAAFNVLAPPTATGGLILGTGSNAYGNLSIGLNNQCLVSNGTTASWGSCATGAGTVTSVGLSVPTGYVVSGSPVTTSGTLSFTSPITSTGDLIIGNGVNSSTRLGIGLNNQCLVSNGTTAAWGSCSSATGTVTSFSAGALSPIFTTSVATATTTPALSFTLSTAGAHAFLGNNTGAVAAPSYVQPAFTDISGTATVAQGGTGQTTASAAFNALAPATATGGLIVGTGANTYGNVGIGTNGQCATSNGTTVTWAACTATLISRIYMPTVLCNAGNPSPLFDFLTVNQASPNCYGTNSPIGALDFANTGLTNAFTDVLLPSDFTSTVDVKLIWFSSSGTSGNAKWFVATACDATDASAAFDSSYNADSTVLTSAPATSQRFTTSTITGLTITGCTAGKLMHIRVKRDKSDAADTLSAIISLRGIELTIRRTNS